MWHWSLLSLLVSTCVPTFFSFAFYSLFSFTVYFNPTLISLFVSPVFFTILHPPLSLSAPFLSPSPWLAVLQAARALQLQRASSCDALLATATAAAAAAAGGEEEDGTGMELTQLLDRIRAQCEQSRLPSPGERHLGLGAISNPAPGLVGPPHAGAGAAAASRTHRGALSEVRIHSYTIFTCLFWEQRSWSVPVRHALRTNSRLSHRQGDACVVFADWGKKLETSPSLLYGLFVCRFVCLSPFSLHLNTVVVVCVNDPSPSLNIYNPKYNLSILILCLVIAALFCFDVSTLILAQLASFLGKTQSGSCLLFHGTMTLVWQQQ